MINMNGLSLGASRACALRAPLWEWGQKSNGSLFFQLRWFSFVGSLGSSKPPGGVQAFVLDPAPF